MHENEISGMVIEKSYEIHVSLGPGLLESVYEKILFDELTNEGLKVTCQQPIPVFWKEKKINLGFRADLIVESKVVVEIKSIERIAPVHPKQLLTYLKLTSCKLGLLINFNEVLVKNGITRIVNNL